MEQEKANVATNQFLDQLSSVCTFAALSTASTKKSSSSTESSFVTESDSSQEGSSSFFERTCVLFQSLILFRNQPFFQIFGLVKSISFFWNLSSARNFSFVQNVMFVVCWNTQHVVLVRLRVHLQRQDQQLWGEHASLRLRLGYWLNASFNSLIWPQLFPFVIFTPCKEIFLRNFKIIVGRNKKTCFEIIFNFYKISVLVFLYLIPTILD